MYPSWVDVVRGAFFFVALLPTACSNLYFHFERDRRGVIKQRSRVIDTESKRRRPTLEGRESPPRTLAQSRVRVGALDLTPACSQKKITECAWRGRTLKTMILGAMSWCDCSCVLDPGTECWYQ
ncbi:hypothetical protein B0I71DRAFT_130434 [Yarrowia lipolytica]|uniref:Uncharacterized protein n=1 Tax=Yarrowia lipolytica TaxID=4952 RepID=A0A371C8M5_YARLL|nr:hypothetical protein B0I71DRAFT_130434 [Yarrowia lipolytica]